MDKDTKNIAGLRFQKYDTGVVHVHDDARSLVFQAKTKDFKKEVEGFLKQKGEGAIVIEGTSKEKLLLIKGPKEVTIAIVLSEPKSMKDFNVFIDSL
jgi:hypothetical protein